MARAADGGHAMGIVAGDSSQIAVVTDGLCDKARVPSRPGEPPNEREAEILTFGNLRTRSAHWSP